MADHNELGKKGETIAADFLRKKGFRILELNWRHRKAEVDIIARLNDLIVVVEVKTRSGNYFGEPEAAVNRMKQKNLMYAADAFIRMKNLSCEVRFDIISIVFSADQSSVLHIEDAFSPSH